MGNQKFEVRIRKNCERFDWILKRRIIEVFESHEFYSLTECVKYIDKTLESEDFVSKYYGHSLKIEIMQDFKITYFITVDIDWDKNVFFLFSSDESVLPIKEEYYHTAKESSIWGPKPEW